MTQEDYNNYIYQRTIALEQLAAYAQIIGAIIGIIVSLWLLKKHG